MIDTHCHIHDDEYGLNADEVLADAQANGVSKLICVGTDAKYSKQAVDYSTLHRNVWATVGLHPHDAEHLDQMTTLTELAANPKVVAIGEAGFDYYYLYSSKEQQAEVLRLQFELANKIGLPMTFHIRGKEDDSSDAYDDFWHIYDKYNLNGVVHSFSAHKLQLEQVIARRLMVGVNGIATFMDPGPQLEAIKEIPLSSLVLETDSPYLTPEPYRGRINEPKYISSIIKFLSALRGETTGEIGKQTSLNAEKLFNI